MNPLALTTILSLFNPYINITSQNSLQILLCYYSLQIFFFMCNLYSWPPCGSTLVLPGYLLLWHSCTWDKTSTLWSCQWVLRKIYRCIILNVNCHEWLYEEYEGSTVMLYWMLNCYGMFVRILQRINYSVYWTLNYYGTFVRVLRKVYYYVIVNVKLLWIV